MISVPKAKTEIFSDPEELARVAAERFLQKLSESQAGNINVALPGGRIYALFFKAIAEEAQKAPGVLDRVHFFWGDERCVPPEHAESNFRLANENFLKQLQIPREHIHRIQGEQMPSVAAELAEQEVRSLVPSEDGFPAFDHILLGMGEDGHVASLFPGEAQDQIFSKSVYRAVVGPKPPPQRVTLGYGTLWAARKLWVLVSGKEKTGALKQSLTPGAATPFGRVLSHREQALILTDCEL